MEEGTHTNATPTTAETSEALIGGAVLGAVLASGP